MDAVKKESQLAQRAAIRLPLARNAAGAAEKAPVGDRRQTGGQELAFGGGKPGKGGPAAPPAAPPAAAGPAVTKLDRDLGGNKGEHLEIERPGSYRGQAPAAPGSAVAGAAPGAERALSKKLKDNVATSQQGETAAGGFAGSFAGPGRRLGQLALQSEIRSAASNKPASGPATEVHLEVTAEAVQTHVFEDLLAHSGAILQIPKSPSPQVPKSASLDSDKPATRGDVVALADGAQRHKRSEEPPARPAAAPMREALQPAAPPTVLVYQVDATPEQLRKVLAQLAQQPAAFSAVTVRPASAASSELKGNGVRAGQRQSAGTDASGGGESRGLAMGRGSAAFGGVAGGQARKAAASEPAAGAAIAAAPSEGAEQEKAAAGPPAPAQRVVFILRVLAPARAKAAKP